jgi:pseudoazurin
MKSSIANLRVMVDSELVRIKPGDTIDFIASDKGHDVHSVSGMIPDDAQSIDGKTNQDTKVTFNQPGVYVITCKVHTRMGMMCVVGVGDLVNIDEIDPSALPRPGPRPRPCSNRSRINDACAVSFHVLTSLG